MSGLGTAVFEVPRVKPWSPLAPFASLASVALRATFPRLLLLRE